MKSIKTQCSKNIVGKKPIFHANFFSNILKVILYCTFQLYSGPKLADLYAELKIQDKTELELKKLKAEDMDKDGMKEAEVRRRLMGEEIYN